MDRQQKKIGEILMEKGLINQEQLDEALNDQLRSKDYLGAILIRRGIIKEKDLAEFPGQCTGRIKSGTM